MKRILKISVFLIVLLFVSLSCTILSAPTPTVETEEVQAIPTALEDSTGETLPGTSLPLDISDQQELFVNLYKKVNPGVVAIRVLSSEGNGLGSGFVIDKDGHIITNFHVVEDARDLEIDFPSGYKVQGEILGTDADSDIAVIKVDAPADELHPIKLGDSNQVMVGQYVFAIGNPHQRRNVH